jgi:predicted nucleic acid-binding protein
MILSAAAEAEAHVLVSSDQDLLVLGSYEGTMILSPRQFLTWLDSIKPEKS